MKKLKSKKKKKSKFDFEILEIFEDMFEFILDIFFDN